MAALRIAIIIISAYERVKFKIKRKSSNKFDEIAPVGNSRYRVRITELHIQSMERPKRFNL
jgi:hypothetical protein